jgi:hypothetical protein
MSAPSIDPNSAVYTTDEVRDLPGAAGDAEKYLVRSALHYPQGAVEENADTRRRGDQGRALVHLNTSHRIDTRHR